MTKDELKINMKVRIGDFYKYSKDDDLMYSSYSNLEGFIIEIEDDYVILYVRDKLKMGKPPRDRAPIIQLEKIDSQKIQLRNIFDPQELKKIISGLKNKFKFISE